MSRAGRPAGRGVDPDRERRVGRVADAQTPGRTPGQDAATVGGERPCPPGAASSDASSHDRPGPHLGSSAVLARDEIPPRRNHADSWLAQPTRLASGAGFPSRSTRRWTGCTSGRQGARGRCALSCATTARAAASNAAGNVAADDLGGVPGPRSLVRPRAGSAVRSPLSRMTRARSWERLSRCRRAPRTSLANWLGGRTADSGPGTGFEATRWRTRRPSSTSSSSAAAVSVARTGSRACCGRPRGGSWRQGLCPFGSVDRRHSVSMTTRRRRPCRGASAPAPGTDRLCGCRRGGVLRRWRDASSGGWSRHSRADVGAAIHRRADMSPVILQKCAGTRVRRSCEEPFRHGTAAEHVGGCRTPAIRRCRAHAPRDLSRSLARWVVLMGMGTRRGIL